jgi:formylmethanofuran dehydrogenase subunit C
MEFLSREDSICFTLRLKRVLDVDCDVSSIRPSMFLGCDRSEIANVSLNLENHSVRLDEVFELIGDPSSNWVFEGDCSRINGIGSNMDSGTILVRGNAGAGLAQHMKAGQIEVLGDCGDFLATGMRNGSVIVHGSAGDYVGGPGVGQRRGMCGGDCIVLGNVGSRIAERMRRGMLYVGGNAGDYGATQMIAGTLIVAGQLGEEWAAGMRRGTIILSHPASHAFAAELTAEREFELSFLPLVWGHLESLLGNSRIQRSNSRWALRQLGDRANRGLGEVLTLTRSTSL